MNNREGYESVNEPFFVFTGLVPVKPANVRNVLRRELDLIGLRSELYDTHSFGIGQATELIKMGFSIEQVKLVVKGHMQGLSK